MKPKPLFNLFAVLFLVLGLSACGGGGDAGDTTTLEQRLAVVKESREKSLKCIHSCGGIFGAQTVYTSSFGANQGNYTSRYYAEGDNAAMRFDSADNTQWTEYTLISADGANIEIQMVTNEGWVANVQFAYGETASQSTNNASVMFYTNTPQSFDTSASWAAGRMGIKTPLIANYSPNLKLRDLLYNPL